MTHDLGKTIKRLREEMRMTQSELAKKAGIGQSMISMLERGERSETTRIVKVAAALGVSASELESGAASRASNVIIEVAHSQSTVRVHAYANTPGAAHGGDLRDDDREGDIDLPAALLGVAPRGQLVTARIAGDSMAETIRDGERIIIDTGDTKIVNGKIYCFRTDDGPLVKRLRRERGRVSVVSDAGPPLFPEYLVDGEPKMIGRVVLTFKQF